MDKLITESRNEKSLNIDQMTTQQIVRVINEEDMSVASAVERAIPQIVKAVDAVYHAFTRGGRLFYVGAGTSGRIAVLDAVECPPTFGTSPEQVQVVMAGGNDAFNRALEGVEDDLASAAADLQSRGLMENDIVLGLAASGRTPYVIGGLNYANEIGAVTVGITNNPGSIIGGLADIKIEVVTGPEVLTGSTRMKAATAQKMILNIISTSVMIKLGKVFENLMIDVKVGNHKLKERAINIIQTITAAERSRVESALKKTKFEVKPAIVMIETGVDYKTAKEALEKTSGFVRIAVELLTRHS